MEVLKPIYAAIAIVGVHILKPFHHLILDKSSKYSTLLKSFPKLYEELISISPDQMLTLEHTFKFATQDQFKNALPNEDLSPSTFGHRPTLHTRSNPTPQLVTENSLMVFNIKKGLYSDLEKKKMQILEQ